MMRAVTNNTEILTLIDSDYPATFHVLKAGTKDRWLVVREDETGSELRDYSLPELQKLLRLFGHSTDKRKLPRLTTATKAANQSAEPQQREPL